jgi:hypothetical protein
MFLRNVYFINAGKIAEMGKMAEMAEMAEMGDKISIASLFPVSCSLFPVPCSLFPVPCSLFPVPYSLMNDVACFFSGASSPPFLLSLPT